MTTEGPGFRATEPEAPPSIDAGHGYVWTVVYPEAVAGQQIAIEPGVVIGRSPDEDVKCVFHPTISRRHARIAVGVGGVPCLEDLGSRNSTQVNGRRVDRLAPLGPQSVVRLGEVLGVVDVPGTDAFDVDAVLPGTSPLMAAARADLARIAADPAPVLITGETGTGKERVARALHARSGRRGQFQALNCAELSPQLIESQLFGHERGAFTGASAAHPGLFVAANGGTLFLDELGELPLELQPKLLRVLQEGEVRPVGGLQTRSVDVRVVAATHQNLIEWIEDGRFRRDLYARLALWEIRLPPLRERRQDIFHWVRAMQAAWHEERGTKGSFSLGVDAAERVLLHTWPDNLRGLNRLVHRLAALADGDTGNEAKGAKPVGLRALQTAAPELFPADARSSAPPPEERASSFPPAQNLGMVRPSKEEFLAVYNAAGQNVTATSKYFGKDRRQIYRWLASFGIPRSPDDE